MTLGTYAAVDAAAIPAVASAIFAAAVGGELGKFPTVALAMYVAADAAAISAVALVIPAAAVGGDAGDCDLMMPTMM